MAACLAKICMSEGLLLCYLILVALLIDGDDEFCNVSDELIAFGFPQCIHTDLQVFHQDFLKRGRKENRYICLQYQVIT